MILIRVNKNKKAKDYKLPTVNNIAENIRDKIF